MNKLSEMISNTYGAKVTIKNVELVMDRITLGKMVELENSGEDIQTLIDSFADKPATVSAKLSWLLLNDVSKEYFDNKFETFLALIDMSELELLSSAVVQALNNSRPVEQNVPGPTA